MVEFNKVAFWSRANALASKLKSGEKMWSTADGKKVTALVFPYGPSDEDVTYSRLKALGGYLFGFEMDKSLIIITTKAVHIHTSPKKIAVLKALDDTEQKMDLIFYEKSKTGNDAEYAKVVNAIKAESDGTVVLGLPRKEVLNASDTPLPTFGKFVGEFWRALEALDGEIVDVTAGLGLLFGTLDAFGLADSEKAGHFCTAVMKRFLQNELEIVFDEDKKIAHSKLAEMAEDVFDDPTKVKSKLSADDLESCYTPIIQSGGVYNLKPSGESADTNIDPGTVVVRAGARYKFWCTNIGRTYFINPNAVQESAYDLLVEVYQACLLSFRDGAKMNVVYETAKKTIEARQPELLAHFTSDCGFGMGVEFRNNSMLLTENNKRTMRKGMIFTLTVGFHTLSKNGDHAVALEQKKKDASVFACLLSDTIVVTEDEPDLLTHAKRRWEDVSYNLGDEADSSSEEEEEGPGKKNLRDRKTLEESSDARRKAHQAALQKKKNEDQLRLLLSGQMDTKFDKEKVEEGVFNAYASTRVFPHQALAAPKQIYVDVDAECILCPVSNTLVPFHIRTLKNATKQDEGKWTELRITFHIPEGASKDKVPYFADFGSNFIRELTYRSTSSSLDRAFFSIKELRKRYMDRQKEHEERKELVAQEDLMISRAGSISKMTDVSIRPRIGGSKKKSTGTLTAHVNGFQFVSSADREKVDIIYTNIKQCFMQPAYKDTTSVIVHFQLKNPILVGKKKPKKTDWVQVFYEVVDNAHDVDTTGRYDDEDGMYEEEEERKTRRRWNVRFAAFVKKCEEYFAKKYPDTSNLEFDVPYRELAFEGVPARQQVQILPTVHCLVALNDEPPFCVALDEVEIIFFERMNFNAKNVDMAIVFKDLDRFPVRIDAIDTKFIEPIKQWLDSCEIIFYESPDNMRWKNILEVIKADPQKFLEDGGWSIFGEQEAIPGEEDDESASESGSEFDPGSESESLDDEEWESASSEAASDDSDIDDDSSDEGEDWDTLDRDAANKDKEKGAKKRERGEADSDEEARSKKKKKHKRN